jgi:hypothetical protein
MQDNDSEEAKYWFTVSDFAALSLDYPLDKVLKDMLQLREQSLVKKPVVVSDDWADPFAKEYWSERN